MKKIAVVILNWNGQKLLKEFLPSVVLHSGLAEIYVADNASADDSIAFLKENYPLVKIIQNPENYGYAKGYNNALKNVAEPYFVLLNSDVEVTENWLQPMIEIFENEPHTVALQPKILDFKNKAYFEYAGAAGGFIDKYAFPFCRGRIFSTLEKDCGQYQSIKEIFWASGACLFIRKETFESLNGFDADFFAHQEEVDLCWRIQNRNLKIKYVPTSVVYHVGGATLKEGSPEKTYLNFRNSLSCLLKNHPKKGLFTTTFIRLSLDGIAGIYFMLQLKPKHTWAIIKSHLFMYANLSKTLKKRGNNQKDDYFYKSSIVFDYFISNRRVFTKLK